MGGEPDWVLILGTLVIVYVVYFGLFWLARTLKL